MHTNHISNPYNRKNRFHPTQHTNKILIACGALFFIVLLYAFLAHLSLGDKKLISQAECVKRTAQADNFLGDAYGREAWNQYINECN